MEGQTREENGNPSLFLHNPKAILGLTTLNQFIYVLFPDKIRVYEQLPQRSTPDLVEEIYLAKKDICRFAVSN